MESRGFGAGGWGSGVGVWEMMFGVEDSGVEDDWSRRPRSDLNGGRGARVRVEG